MNPSANRRRLGNFIIEWRSWLRLSVPFLIVAIVSMTILFTVRWRVMLTLESTEVMGAENLSAMNHLLDMQRSVTRLAAVGFALLVALCLGLWIVISHRIFGPMVAIKRHVRNLIAGDYRSRIVPRANDEFKDLASDLNALAEQLEAANKTRS